MPEYKVVHVTENAIHFGVNNGVQEVPRATEVMNWYAAKGWRVVSFVPGPFAQAFGGLFITFVRE